MRTKEIEKPHGEEKFIHLMTKSRKKDFLEEGVKMSQEFTDWEIQKTLIWKFETLMSDKEYKETKKQLIKMGYIKTTGKGVKLTEKGLSYIQEEFGLIPQDI